MSFLRKQESRAINKKNGFRIPESSSGQANTDLKKQVETLKADKGKSDAQVKDLSAKVEALTKENADLKAKPAAKAPAKAPAKKK
ncbi:MAG: hypothetical protein HZC10_00430 [Nitrospirae bacterium]|nr:hypothetical protein [Nitrospirota bacterium]